MPSSRRDRLRQWASRAGFTPIAGATDKFIATPDAYWSRRPVAVMASLIPARQHDHVVAVLTVGAEKIPFIKVGPPQELGDVLRQALIWYEMDRFFKEAPRGDDGS